MTDTRIAPAELDIRRVQRRTVAVLMVSQALAGLAQTSLMLGAPRCSWTLCRSSSDRGCKAVQIY